MDIKEIAQIMELADELRPIVGTVIETANSFRPEFSRIADDLIEPLRESLVAFRIRSIRQYRAEGLTLDQAITMVIADAAMLRDISPKMNAKK
jgi:hypothetical protein